MKNLMLILGLSLALVACDKLEKADEAMKAVKDMNAKMDNTNDTMSGMAYDLRLGVALQNFLVPENWDVTDPISFKLAPWADTFAKYAKSRDLLKLAQTWLTLEVNSGKVMKDVADDGSNIPLTTQQKARLNNQKRAVVYFFEMIAGLLPASTTNELILEAQQGEYAPTALKLLMLRYAFIKDFQFGTVKMEETFTNVAMAQAAFNELDKADALARLDSNHEIAFETTGLKKLTDSDDEEDPNFHWHIDPSDLKSSWEALLNRLDTDIQPGGGVHLGMTSNQKKNQNLQEAQRVQSLKSQIQQRVRYWEENGGTRARVAGH